MCGVIGLRCERDRADLGEKASALLRMLEYRGYDSTGALIQSEDGRTELRKDVGSPTLVTKRLGIGKLSGKLFCGQVRWATFGAVTPDNAQPHQVRCKTHLYGAHNGNITNCSQLKDWLASEGHRVVSDNDGEMLVHTVEHFFARLLAALGGAKDGAAVPADVREAALKAAILQAAQKMIGSYAAVIVDPVTHLMAAIKAGSSLYMGLGHDAEAGSFILASSDLASVLSQTKILAPIREDEFALYDHARARFYNLRTGDSLRKTPVRSRLKVEETELQEPFRYFMQQEIFAQPDAVRKVFALFLGRSARLEASKRLLGGQPAVRRELRKDLARLSAITHAGQLRRAFETFLAGSGWRRLGALAGRGGGELAAGGFESSMAGLLEELSQLAPARDQAAVRLVDGACLLDEFADIDRRLAAVARRVLAARAGGRTIYLVACGTSFNAAKVAAVFFNAIAGVRVSAMLPGDFRAECVGSLRDGDLIIGISQSGETKDLIDVINLARRSKAGAGVVTLVNNVNSTLALEKADVCLPLACGPEIAVPATKSFMNQLAVLYILALRVGERSRPDRDARRRLHNLLRVPALLEETLAAARRPVAAVAQELFLAPSLHILAIGMQGVAKEGALKIREVALNHTEGYEGAEFKHGPNTILGVNTIFGLDAVLGLARDGADGKAGRADRLMKRLYTNYPLVFVTGPAERDVHLTISQINTHKIRGANIYVVAEEDDALRDAACRRVPTGYEDEYRSGYIALPRTGDDLLPFFSSALVLQMLALEMSVRKLACLDELGIEDHGVHPDSPKNVSKSITVD